MTEWIVTSSVLTALVIAARYALRGKISLRLQYGLWLLVLLRLLIPVNFGSAAVSVANVAAPTRPLGRLPQTVVTYVGGQLPQSSISEPDPSLPEAEWEAQYEENKAAWQAEIDVARAETGTPISVGEILLGIWAGGAVVLAGILIVSNLRFARMLRRRRTPLSVGGIRLPVYRTAAVDTPCLYGLFRPAIYVTPAVQDRRTMVYVLAHEETHFRHGDHVWSALRCLCLVVHWYNPLVWWAAALSRRDGELACDEATIARLGEAQRADYGRALLDLTCQKPSRLLVTATTMTGGAGSLKERIRLLVKRPRTTLGIALAVVLVAAIAVGCTFTGAANAQEPETVSDEAPETPAEPESPAGPADPQSDDGGASDGTDDDAAIGTAADAAADGPWTWAQGVTAEQLGGGDNAIWLARILNSLDAADFLPVENPAFGVYGYGPLGGGAYSLTLQESGEVELEGGGETWRVNNPELLNFLVVQSGDGDGSGAVEAPRELHWVRAWDLPADTKAELIAQLTQAESFRSWEPSETLSFGDGWMDAGGWAHVQYRADDINPATILEAAAAETSNGVWTLYTIGYAPSQELWTGTPDGQPMTSEELADWSGWLITSPMEPGAIRQQFLTSYYDKPENIDLFQLFYNGCADGGYTNGRWTQPPEAEAEEVLGGPVAQDCSKVTTAEMERCLETYLGLSLGDTWGYNLNLFTYSEKYDAYYHVHGDTNTTFGALQSGWNMPDGSVRLWYGRSAGETQLVNEVALTPDGRGGWHFLYNLPMSGGDTQ